jgi:hypothetical protein
LHSCILDLIGLFLGLDAVETDPKNGHRVRCTNGETIV